MSPTTSIRWSNSPTFLPLVRAPIVSRHLTQNFQLCVQFKPFNFSPQVRWKYEPAVLGEKSLNMTSVYALIPVDGVGERFENVIHYAIMCDVNCVIAFMTSIT